ncbi:MAG: hypothetical protein IPL74_19350 [Bacteroidetes bacterium]|nr:hypothetical protein [Bacteroidota bacterium]
MKYFVYCLVLVLITACNPVVRLLYGVKNPKVESKTTIEKFCNEMQFPNVPLFVAHANNFFVKKQLSDGEVYVFDRKGNFIPYKDPAKPNCSGPADLFLSYLDTATVYHVEPNFPLDSIEKLLTDFECKMVEIQKDDTTDFYVFITFAKYLGKKYQKQKASVWIDTLQQNTNVRSRLFLIDMDPAACWTEEQKAVFRK